MPIVMPVETLVIFNRLVIMLEVEGNEENDSESRDLYQDRSTQGTLLGGSPISQTRVKT